MNEQIRSIANIKVRELAERSLHTSRGDFGMVIEGGIDIEQFALAIIRECANVADDKWMSASAKIYNHFNITYDGDIGDDE